MTLKTNILLVPLLLFSFVTYAQKEKNTEQVKKEIILLFAKADKKNLQNILPYKIGNRIGFVDAKTKRKLLDPTDKLSDISLFNPKMKGVYMDQYKFEVDARNFNVEVTKIEPSGFDISCTDIKVDKIKLISSKDGYKGFKVDNNGKLTAYSDLYNVEECDWLNVTPFKFQGKYYAIARKKTGVGNYSGIIDSVGNPLPHFNFIHKGIILIDEAGNDEDIWFFTGVFRDMNGSFLSFNGKEKFKNKLLSYPRSGSDIFGYNINSSEDGLTSGVLDIAKIQWVIKPQTKLKIIGLSYSSLEDLYIIDHKNRTKATIYYKVEENGKEYYIDQNLQKCLPNK